MLRTWDIETGINARFKRKGSPFGAGNHVVVHGFKDRGGPVHVHFFGRQPPGPGWLRPVLEGCKLLVGFNIKFDLLHALQDPDNLVAYMSWIAGGGQLWDCQLAEYLLNGMSQRDQMLSLDEVAPRYGGGVKIDEVKALWAAGVNTPDIEPELLKRYLAGGNDEHGVYQPGDVENTERVALGQIARARDAGQLASIMLNMGALVASIEMERNGMFVDAQLGLSLAAKLKEKIDEVASVLRGFLPADLPFEFKWSSRHHKSALIFGGRVKYPKREYQLAKDYGCAAAGEYLFEEDFASAEDFRSSIAYAQKDELHYVVRFGGGETTVAGDKWDEFEKNYDTQGECPERVCYVSGKNAGEFKTKKVKVPDLTKPKSRMGEDYYTFPGFTAPDKRWETSEKGVYSVSDDVIEELGARDIPFLKALSQLQSMTKDLGTYYIVTDEDGASKGMLALVDEHGLIHHKINHTSTVTGRFSSSDPNLQNVPKGNKSQIKLVFVSRFGADGKIIQSDFSALEVYIQAILTQCEQLIADLRAGLDMHVKRLAVKEGIPYEECLVKCKGDKAKGVEPIKEWDYKRTGAKVFSFQRAYGAGAAKIAASTGMPIEDVEALIAAEDLEYPEIGEFYARLADTLKENRVPVRTLPHPEFPGVMCHIGESTYRTPDGKLYLYTEHPAPEFVVKKGVYANFSPTEIKNYVVQGEGGEWMKAAMWLAVRAFYARQNFGGKALLVNTVHDALYADVHQAVALEAAALVHACMEAASDFMEFYFKWTIPVPVPSDTTWGASMMDEETIPGLKELAKEERLKLRREYMKGYTPSFAQH